MRTRLASLILVALLALVGAGCGSDDSDSEGDTGPAQTTAEAGGADAGSGDGGGEARRRSSDSGGGQGGGAEPVDKEKLAEEFKAPPGGDDSIQTFGEVAEDEQEQEIVGAMRSFMRSLAAGNARKVCAGLSEGNRKQIELFLKAKKEEGDCSTVIAKFLRGQNKEARQAANGTIYQVRVEGENAFVLFVPQGGRPSYFVMKREGDGWKSTSLAAGTPFDPIPPPEERGKN